MSRPEHELEPSRACGVLRNEMNRLVRGMLQKEAIDSLSRYCRFLWPRTCDHGLPIGRLEIETAGRSEGLTDEDSKPIRPAEKSTPACQVLGAWAF